jgi:hypothetical protein
MKKLKKSSENEMIALFLKEELFSKRFSKKLLKVINRLNVDTNIISNYDLNNNNENEIRKEILKAYRGYGNNTEIFKDFPSNINWYWCELKIQDILNIKFIDYDYWTDLTNGTRYIKDSKENILNGKEIYGVSNKPFIDGANYIKEGNKFEPLILLASIKNNDEIIVLEGHSRLASMSLVLDYIDKIDALVGFVNEEDLYKWNKY